MIEVNTTLGRVRGMEGEGVTIFRGIRFAAPPAGEHRLRPPRPLSRWSGVVGAQRFGPVCPQMPRPNMTPEPQSEDCLYLNVWTPAVDDVRRPVMVWIHGGAFRAGSGSNPTYDGTRLVRRGNVVLVTLNYRLGALGFLHAPDLGGVNLGMQDQVAALRWVRDNIEAFGGDAENVTIFGESAGAKSVEVLLAMPSARGLFQRAIIQSTYDADMSVATGDQTTASLMEEAGLEPYHREGLRELPASALLEAQTNLILRGPAADLLTSGLVPVVDGDLVAEHPLDAVRNGAAATVPLLIGTTRDEMTLFAAMTPQIAEADAETLARGTARYLPAGAATEQQVLDLMRTYGDLRSRRGESVSPLALWCALATDRVFRQHSIHLAEAQSHHPAPVFMYMVDFVSTVDPSIGSPHAIDVPLVFGNLEIANNAGDTPEARHVSDRMQAAWLAFVHTGRPETEALPHWAAYETSRRQTMILGLDCHVESAPREDERLLWQKLGY